MNFQKGKRIFGGAVAVALVAGSSGCADLAILDTLEELTGNKPTKKAQAEAAKAKAIEDSAGGVKVVTLEQYRAHQRGQ